MCVVLGCVAEHKKESDKMMKVSSSKG